MKTVTLMVMLGLQAVAGRVRQLRDPGIFFENGKTYLLHSIAGESALAISELAAPRTR